MNVLAYVVVGGLAVVVAAVLAFRLKVLERELGWARRDAIVGVARSVRLEGDVAAVRDHLRAAEELLAALADDVRVSAANVSVSRRARGVSVHPREIARRLRDAAACLEEATRALDHLTSTRGRGPPPATGPRRPASGPPPAGVAVAPRRMRRATRAEARLVRAI